LLYNNRAPGIAWTDHQGDSPVQDFHALRLTRLKMRQTG